MAFLAAEIRRRESVMALKLAGEIVGVFVAAGAPHFGNAQIGILEQPNGVFQAQFLMVSGFSMSLLAF